MVVIVQKGSIILCTIPANHYHTARTGRFVVSHTVVLLLLSVELDNFLLPLPSYLHLSIGLGPSRGPANTFPSPRQGNMLGSNLLLRGASGGTSSS